MNLLLRRLVILLAPAIATAISAGALAENPAPKLKIDDSSIDRDGKISATYAPIVKKVAPSVVYIYASKTVKDADSRLAPFFNDPLWKRFFGNGEEEEPQPGQPGRPGRRGPRSHKEQGLGSGVIVTEDGYIMTNNHVVDGADEIRVSTSAGKEYTAKVVGADSRSDSAVLKIDGEKFQAATLGNSDALEVGDLVFAIGNPFGIGQTVTMGIVSAVGRTKLGITDYEDFIQTDASINPGNSGGPLVDAAGRVVGINTAILSRSGGNQGVGFAVPIKMARNIMESLVVNGRVARGYLGVAIQPVTPDLAKAFNLPETTGALVGGVSEDTPAQEAGIRPGDIVTEYNGKKVTDDRHLRLMVSQTPPKTKIHLQVNRDGKSKEFDLKLAELPSDPRGRPEESPADLEDNGSLDGVEVGDVDAKTRKEFDIPPKLKGAIVTSVDPESASYTAGLRPGQVIVEVDRQPVSSADEVVELTKKAKGKNTLVRVWTRGASRFLFIPNEKTPK